MQKAIIQAELQEISNSHGSLKLVSLHINITSNRNQFKNKDYRKKVQEKPNM